jgi:carbamoylphosphate synthase large subunit
VTEIGNIYTITERRGLDVIVCKMIEAFGMKCVVNLNEGMMCRGSMEMVGSHREENQAAAGHPLVRNRSVKI